MESILLVSGSDKSRAQLAELLDVSASGRLVTAESGSEARRLLLTGEFSLVVINAPLPDEFGSDLSVYAAHHTAAGVVLLVGSSLADQVGARVESDGVFLVPKPISRSLFSQTLKLALAAHWRITGLKK